ncbi:organic cation/carnitine transporter 2-like isoform X2 [Cetorhinus maximus]
MRDYDEITAFLGEWGPYQMFVFCVLSLSIFPNGFCGMSFVFVGDVPEHRCSIPGNLNLSEAWMNRTIPLEQERGKLLHSKCRRYRLDAIVNLSETFPNPDSCNMSEVEQEPCLDGWEYSKDQYISTIVSEVWEEGRSVWNYGCTDCIQHASSILSNLGNILLSEFPCGCWTDFKLCGCLCSWFVHESPRWLLSKGRVTEAEATLRFMAKKNNVTPPAVLFNNLELEDLEAKRKISYTIIHLVKTHNIRAITVICLLVWMIMAVGYFGLSLSTPNLHGDAYLNCFFSAAIEVPAYIAAWLFLQRFSRRFSLSGSFSLGGIVLFFIQLIPSNLSAFATVLVMIGKFGATSAFAIVYVYTAELYPTVVRNMGVGVSSVGCRFGAIISPYIFYLGFHNEFLPFILIGSLTVFTAILVLFLPETLNIPLPETIDQMQEIKGFKCRSTHRNHEQFCKNGTTRETVMMVHKKEEI